MGNICDEAPKSDDSMSMYFDQEGCTLVAVETAEEGLKELVVAKDVSKDSPPSLTREDTLGTAMGLLARRDVPALPVMEGRDSRKVVGLVRRDDVLAAYNSQLLVRYGEEPVGHLVLRSDTDAHGLRRGRIVDLVWPRRRRDVAEWLIERSCWELQQDGADYVECVASVPDLLAALRARGFRTRGTVPIWYHRLPADEPAPDNWYVTFLDCDRAYR